MRRILFIATMFLIFTTSNLLAGPPTDIEILGRHIYKDKDISFNGKQSCQDCHYPWAGFADKTNLLDPYENVVSTGADGVSKGGRNAPTSAYAGYSPSLDLVGGEWIGGLFWDGRADGSSELGDPLAEQALGPPTNPVEMANDVEGVVTAIATSSYAQLFMKVFGKNIFDDIDEAYNMVGVSVAAYERSKEVTRFSSKFDVARNDFTESEKSGFKLFQTNCSSCHSIEPAFGAPSAIFTTYGYANIGVPANPLVPGDADPGLGAIVGDPAQDGKFKIPTLRNVEFSPPYSHNGSFPTLLEMVNFINDRSTYTPETEENIDTSVGSLELSESEIADIVSFLMTLTDNY